MSRIPQCFIDELLARTDIVEVIENYVPLKRKGREYVGCCPFHHEKTPSFTVSQDKQFYHCFGCGAHGTALGFMLDYEHLDFVEAVEALARRIGLDVPREGGPTQAERHDDLYEVLDQTARLYQTALRNDPDAINYLRNRGLSGEIARDYGLGYAPPDPSFLVNALGQAKLDPLTRAGLMKQGEAGREKARFRNRIMFPIRDRRGRVIGFGGRVLDDGLPKYLNSPETPLFHKNESLYGLCELRKALGRPERVLVVEGYVDVLALAQCGLRNAVATLGTATSLQHIQLLFRQTHEIVFCFDGDRAGREAAWRATQQLMPVFNDGAEARFMFLADGDDPDSLIRREGKDAFTQRIASAVPLSEYLFTHLTEKLEIDHAAGRARLAELAKPLLLKLPDGVFKQLMYKELSARVGASVGESASSTGKRRPRQRLLQPGSHSPVRRAIAMLLTDPALARQAPAPEQLRDLEMPGIPLLLHMLETLRADPHLTPASLVERYRHSEHHVHLLKLMAWRLPAEDFDLAAEFRGTVATLCAKALKQRTDWLLIKERQEGLNVQEQLKLQELLGRKAAH
ncbi:MAG: DNA primase [Gammaproteobacteria bacterium]